MGCLNQLEMTMAAPGTIEAPQIHHQDLEASDHGWIVTVYNNDYNTYEEVITILILATGCLMEEAEMEAWEVDHLGRSVVHHGKETDCRKAGEIIGKIGIRVEVTQE
jgi:hypothetical protein